MTEALKHAFALRMSLGELLSSSARCIRSISLSAALSAAGTFTAAAAVAAGPAAACPAAAVHGALAALPCR